MNGKQVNEAIAELGFDKYYEEVEIGRGLARQDLFDAANTANDVYHYRRLLVALVKEYWDREDQAMTYRDKIHAHAASVLIDSRLGRDTTQEEFPH